MKNSVDRPFFKYLAYLLVVILIGVLQSTPKLLPEFRGGKPFLLLALALAIASFEDFIPTVVYAAVCGVFSDLNCGGTVGYFAIAFTLVCAAIWYLAGMYLNATLFTFIITSAAAIAAVLGVFFLMFRLTLGVEDPGALFVSHYLPRMGITLLCAVPLYFLIWFLHNSFTAKQAFLRDK